MIAMLSDFANANEFALGFVGIHLDAMTAAARLIMAAKL